MPAQGMGPMGVANPSSCRTFTAYFLPIHPDARK
jgi:hypothetical protein